MKKKKGRFWRITMMNRHKESVLAEIPTTHITEGQLITLLKTLYSKHFLTDNEIVDSHVRKNTNRYRNLIPVHPYHSHDPISYMLPSGGDWVHAIVVRPEDQKHTEDG
jgi:hypothetical protein